MNSSSNQKSDHMKIGRYQSWLEGGKLKMYCHEFGSSNGTYTTLSAEETRGLLELLSRNSDGIDEALVHNEREHAHTSHTAYAGI
ncbi:hypothetical protein ccbrp13_35020 [Ktedonobacteria bacterium brp13]|nr:hypothetical protein ccbrp13_35020 [Ktedonobacteria bacterium brp13]